MFIEDGAYTTVTSAVAMLMVFAILFSALLAVWSAGRAGDVQVAADTTAIAGENVVASYHTAATVIDASVLSLGLAGFAMVGTGMIGAFVPGAHAAAAKTLDMGIDLIKMRNKLSASASSGLQKLEGSLPFLIAANATHACAAQGTDATTFTGSALPAPATSASKFPALDGGGIEVDGLERASDELERTAKELARASEEAAAKKEAAWLADCGHDGMNMQERAAKLAKLTADENPDYASSLTWDPNVALDRTRAYYRWRYDHDGPEGSGVEALADAAARHAFYGHALTVFENAHVDEAGGTITSTVELLPRNTDEVRRTELYTEAVWPSSYEDGVLTLHCCSSCPGLRGPAGPALPLSAIDEGIARECKTCRFGIDDIGHAPAASTSIDNGFEYHLRAFTLALNDYIPARQRELDEQRRATAQAHRAGDAFDEAISALSGKRPRIAPPGRDGCIAFVIASQTDSPDGLSTSFAATEAVAERGAISAAVLAPDGSAKGNNVLSGFFDSLEAQVGDLGPAGLIDSVMGLWGKLLASYGDISQGIDEAFSKMAGHADGLGAGPVGSWLKSRLQGVVRTLGIEPIDLRQRKPVLTDSALVAKRAGMDQLTHVQSVIRSIPVGATDPGAIIGALGYDLGEHMMSIEFTLAEIPLPGGGTVPLVIRLRDIVGEMRGGG